MRLSANARASRATALLLSCGMLLALTACGAPEYDVVILNGRVIAPEGELDAVRNIGIRGGSIEAISTQPLNAPVVIDAAGLVVSPGFIDINAHGLDAANNRFQVMDGVTTALELETGTDDVDTWYSEREGKSVINYGVGAGHIPIRMRVMQDSGYWLPSGPAAHRAATEPEIAEMKRLLDRGLERGAIAVGFGMQYTPAASRWEVLEMFRVASGYGAVAHVHQRHMGRQNPSSIIGLEEILAASAITGTPLHMVHVHSSGLAATARLLQMIGEARARGLDVTTELYPYTAAMTLIHSALFDEGWQAALEITYSDVEWAATGERLTPATFAQYRRPPGGWVVMHMIPEEALEAAVMHPITIIASDGRLENGKTGHPRSSGTFARVLGRFVREQKWLTLRQAITKMTLMPAQRLEARVPAMKNKGRIAVGADADLTIFDPERVIDRSTYQNPAQYSDGIVFVLVNGVVVVSNAQLQEGVAPGRPIRAPIKPIS